jgi:hypothetical protein
MCHRKSPESGRRAGFSAHRSGRLVVFWARGITPASNASPLTRGNRNAPSAAVCTAVLGMREELRKGYKPLTEFVYFDRSVEKSAPPIAQGGRRSISLF